MSILFLLVLVAQKVPYVLHTLWLPWPSSGRADGVCQHSPGATNRLDWYQSTRSVWSVEAEEGLFASLARAAGGQDRVVRSQRGSSRSELLLETGSAVEVWSTSRTKHVLLTKGRVQTLFGVLIDLNKVKLGNKWIFHKHLRIVLSDCILVFTYQLIRIIWFRKLNIMLLNIFTTSRLQKLCVSWVAICCNHLIGSRL